MFYCQPCADERRWPETMSKSRGKCEVCGAMATCNERASALLPAREPQPTDGPDYHADHAYWRSRGGR